MPHVLSYDAVQVLSNLVLISIFLLRCVEEMIRGLTQIPWERVDVSFQKSRQRYIAHNTIQASLLI